MTAISSLKAFIQQKHRTRHRMRSPYSYIFALLVVLAAALLRLWLSNALSARPFLAFYPALVVAAAFGGFGPGLLSTLLSWLCVTLFFDETPRFIGLKDPAELGRLIVFLFGGLGISFVSEAQLRAHERVIRQSKEIEELGQVTDSGPFMIRDANDRIIHWSEGCARLFGYSAKQALGCLSHELLQTQFPEPLDKINATLRESGRWEGELIRIRADATVISVASLWILRDRATAPVILEISSDITRLKLAESNLLRTSHELERSNKDLEAFAYIASHDLQEPLRTITGFLQLLEQKIGNQLDEKSKKYIFYAVDGSKRLHQMIADLLAYSRVSMQPFTPKAINLRQPLDQALSLLRKSIEDSGAAFVIRELPLIRADASQMVQVFQNLLGNAMKFRSERPLTIEVGAKKELHFWKLWIQDNGIGFDPKQGEKIFQLFQRLHTRQKYAGSGIGLSICRKIIERHSGTIWVDSSPNVGSTFYFTLPAD